MARSGTLTVNKGITSSSGNLSLAGNISTSNGNISTSNGYISSTGNISTSNGNISASNGSLSITSQNNSVILVADTGFNVSGNKTSYLANFTNTNSSGSGIYIKTGGIGSQVSPWAIFVENGANSKKYGLALTLVVQPIFGILLLILN